MWYLVYITNLTNLTINELKMLAKARMVDNYVNMSNSAQIPKKPTSISAPGSGYKTCSKISPPYHTQTS